VADLMTLWMRVFAWAASGQLQVKITQLWDADKAPESTARHALASLTLFFKLFSQELITVLQSNLTLNWQVSPFRVE
jgi:hypothetical protein